MNKNDTTMSKNNNSYKQLTERFAKHGAMLYQNNILELESTTFEIGDNTYYVRLIVEPDDKNMYLSEAELAKIADAFDSGKLVFEEILGELRFNQEGDSTV